MNEGAEDSINLMAYLMISLHDDPFEELMRESVRRTPVIDIDSEVISVLQAPEIEL